MEINIDSIKIKLEHVIQNPNEVKQISGWAEEQYSLYRKKGFSRYLRNRLIVDILHKLRDFNDPLLCDLNIEGQETISSSYLSEIQDIYEFLTGKKKFVEVVSIQENLLDTPNDQLLFVYPLISDLLMDIRLSKEALKQLESMLLVSEVNLGSECVLNEAIVAMLHINESLKFSKNEIVSIGSLGKSATVTVLQEKKVLRELLEIIEGKRAYRLTVCIVQQELYYTNFIPL